MSLENADFITAARMAQKINETTKMAIAEATDPRTIRLDIPTELQSKVVELIASIQEIEITPDQRAKVVINERTGTVVIGDEVKISSIAISHGNLTIEVREKLGVSQPQPLSPGQTVVVPQTEVNIQEEPGKLIPLAENASIGDLVKALNAIGVTSRDLIAILQSMRSAGALHADLEII